MATLPMSVWSLSTGKRALHPLEHQDALVTAIEYSQHGWASSPLPRGMILFGQNGCLLVDVLIQVNPKHNRSLAWASDGKWREDTLAVRSSTIPADSSVSFWDATIHKSIGSGIEHTQDI